METLHGQIFALYLFDVAEAANLERAASAIGGSERPKFSAKSPTPSYINYQQPPLWFDGAAIDVPSMDGFQAGFKLFDYGVVSLRLTRPFSGTWQELADISSELIENDALERRAEEAVRGVADRLRASMVEPRANFLSEDYLVLAIHEIDRVHTADDLIEYHGDVIAALVRGERGTLSRQERDEVLRHRLSYLANDLVIPTWNAAFVYDTLAGAQAAVEIAEFANSQLLQFRYYDELLDNALARIYGQMQREPRWYDSLAGRHYARAARQVHSLLIDVNELTDRTENALKIVGDVYAARLFALVGARLDLARWKTNVSEKLKTLDDIYRFSVERLGMVRGELLEAAIVAILVFELVLFFLGIMQ
jgi:hypothetical protein